MEANLSQSKGHKTEMRWMDIYSIDVTLVEQGWKLWIIQKTLDQALILYPNQTPLQIASKPLLISPVMGIVENSRQVSKKYPISRIDTLT